MDIEKASVQTINALFTFISGLENTVLWFCTANYEKQLFLSDGFEKVWGRPNEQLYQNIALWSESVFPEDLSLINKELTLRSHKADRCSTVNFRIHRPDGQNRWIKNTAYTLSDKNGNPTGILGIDENLAPEQWLSSIGAMQQPIPLLKEFSKIITKELKLENGNLSNKLSIPPTLSINNKIINLTAREVQCLQYLLEGKSAKETAYLLNLSTRTIEAYLDKIRHKSNCRTKLMLIGKLQQQFLEASN
jgi:DNA-binding CsgD family transcriptional regulator